MVLALRRAPPGFPSTASINVDHPRWTDGRPALLHISVVKHCASAGIDINTCLFVLYRYVHTLGYMI